MTKNSVICSTLSTKKDWRIWVKDAYGKNLIFRENGNLAIFLYGYNADFHDPFIREARGIIIDTSKWEVVCWPFTKFGEHDSDYADEIDWESARVEQKIDGSLIKLWFNHDDDKWVWSTNGCIYAKDAISESGISFEDVIKSTQQYEILHGDGNYERLDKDMTYMFELQSPSTRVIIKYNQNKLTLIGQRCNKDGVEYIPSIMGIARPKSSGDYNYKDCPSSLEGVITLCKKINSKPPVDSSEDNVSNRVLNYEGFVVVDKYFHRIKVKNPIYLLAARLCDPSATKSTKEKIIDIFHNEGFKEISGGVSVDDFCDDIPGGGVVLKYYDYKYSEFKERLMKNINICRKIYELYDNDRKMLAQAISSSPYKPFIFEAISKLDIPSEKFFQDLPVAKICKYIPTYELENLSSLLGKAYMWNKEHHPENAES